MASDKTEALTDKQIERLWARAGYGLGLSADGVDRVSALDSCAVLQRALKGTRAEVVRLNADLDDVPDLVAKLSTTRQARDALAKLLVVDGKCVRCGCSDDKHDGTCDALPYLLDVALDEEWLRGIQEANR